MRRYHALSSLAAIIALLLVGCGGSSNNGKVTINWEHIDTTDPLKSGWQNLANQYMASHPNVTIKITIVSNDAFKTKLNTQMQAGTPPDLFQSWGGGVMQQYAQAGLLQDITAQTQDVAGNFTPAVLNLYTVNGKRYGIPWDAGAVGFWYNKTMFQQAGITDVPPASQPPSWDQFTGWIKKLQAKGITPIALGAKDQWPGAFWWEYFATRIGGQAEFNKAYGHQGGSFTDSTFVQAGQYLQQLVALHPFQNGFLGSSYGDEQALMGNGKAAMELMGQWAPSNDAANATNKQLPAPFGYFSFPMIPGGAGQPTDVLGGGNGFAVGKNAPPEAVDFLKFLTQADNLAPLGAKGALLPPVPAAQSSITDANSQAVLSQLKSATYYQLYYDQFMSPAVGNTVNQQTAALFAGSASPQQVAQAIDSAALANK
jgi:raffinose/stachyose/melibiose transport system substrate-binding protein